MQKLPDAQICSRATAQTKDVAKLKVSLESVAGLPPLANKRPITT